MVPLPPLPSESRVVLIEGEGVSSSSSNFVKPLPILLYPYPVVDLGLGLLQFHILEAFLAHNFSCQILQPTNRNSPPHSTWRGMSDRQL